MVDVVLMVAVSEKSEWRRLTTEELTTASLSRHLTGVAGGTDRKKARNLQRWNNKGVKLLSMGHAGELGTLGLRERGDKRLTGFTGTMYLLVLTAAFNLQSFFNVGDTTGCHDVQSMSWTLRRVPGESGLWALFVATS